MASRVGWFVLGSFTAAAAIIAGGCLFVALGGVPMETTAAPLPFETTLAKLAIHASVASAADRQNPLPFSEANLVAGAHLFKRNCAVCHSTPGQPRTAISNGEFPKPPRLFENGQMVTDDPEGVTHWKVTHGIRLSGMPGFGDALSDTERWQLTMLVAHADKLSPAVQAILSGH
ncbi:MAG TPA: c-type cytochrome [Candidatus Binataceae bacterium]|nr:c-type cytochrome [Candidatus Binataceae bacterium]